LKSLLLFLILFLSLRTTSYAEDTFVIKNEQWTQYVNTLQFSKRLSLTSDVDFRWKDKLSLKSQYIFRSGIGYKIQDNLQCLLGFAHLGFYSDQKISKLEYRPFQQLSYKHKLNQLRFSHRLRIEQRYFYTKSSEGQGGSTSFNYRFRYRIALRKYLFGSDKLSFGLSNEILFNGPKENVKSPFDQNRLILGPAYHFTKNFSLNLYYQNLISPTSARNSYNFNHIALLSIKHKIDLSKS